MAEDTEDTPKETEGTPAPGDATDPKGDVTDQDEEDPTEKAFRSRLAAELEKAKQELEEKVNRDAEERRERERQAYEAEMQAQQLLSSFGSTVHSIREGLKKKEFWDDEGNRRTLTDQEIEELVIRPMANLNLTQDRAAALRLSKQLADAALASLPEDKREDFKKQASGKDISEWLDHYSELRAPKTKYAQRLELERKAAEEAAEARGYNKAKKTPPAPPGTSESERKQVVDTGDDLNSISGLLKARHAGKVPDDVFYQKAKALGLFS